MKTRILSSLFALIMSVNVFATSIWSGGSDIFTHGTGTQANPYLIESADQLSFIAEMVNAGVTDYSGIYFKQTADFDLNNIAWTPIGDNTHPFGGNYDGNGHSITNMSINSGTDVGLFGVVNGGVFKKLTISGTISATATNAGSLIGRSTSLVTIDSCTNRVFIKNATNAGGIIGNAEAADVQYCFNNAEIVATQCAGGIVGIGNSNSQHSKISFCINEADIHSIIYAGGIVGKINHVEYYSLYNSGNINIVKSNEYRSYSSSKLYEYKIGTYAGKDDIITINLVKNNYSVRDSCFVGGICGLCKNAIVKSCFNQGSLNGIILGPNSVPSQDAIIYTGYITCSASDCQVGKNSLYTYYSNYYSWNIKTCVGGLFGEFSGKISQCINYGKLFAETKFCTQHPQIDSDLSTSHIYNAHIRLKTFYTNVTVGLGSITEWNERAISSAGGLIGNSIGEITIDRSANHGDVNGGGIIGTADNPVFISYSYNIGAALNGLGASKVNVSNSYNAGNTSNLGLSSGTVTNSYYISGSGNGTKKTETQMKSVTMPILLNADSTVFIQDVKPNVNHGYPIFKDGMKYVSTNEPTEVEYTRMILHGAYYHIVPDSMGFEIYMPDGNWHSVQADTLNYALNNLEQGVTYAYKYWVSENGFKYYGDSIPVTTLACPAQPVRSDTVKICQGETFWFAGKELAVAGTYYDSLVATTGCDSIVQLVLEIYDTYKYTREATINRGESYEFYGQYLTEPGVYNEYIPITNRCNWVQLTLNVLDSDKTLTLTTNNSQWGSVVGAGTYTHAERVAFSAIPATECYFVQWSDGVTTPERAITLTKDTVIMAIFALNQYSVLTNATNGTVVGSGIYDYGTIVTLTATADEHYHFVRWSDGLTTATRDVIVTKDSIFTAIFDINKYTVIFENYDGTTLQSSNVNYGATPTYTGPTPTKASDAQYDYTFAGWTPAIASVTGDATYTATYDRAVRNYTVTWLDENGVELNSEDVAYGTIPTHTALTKESTAQYTYTWNGWNKTVVAVSGNVCYQSLGFTANLRSYTINFEDEDGTTLQSSNVDYGATPIYTGSTPTKASDAQYDYTFAGWTPDIASVTGTATYTATYDAIPIALPRLEIPITAGQWHYIAFPVEVTSDMIEYAGNGTWGYYDGARRASGVSGWQYAGLPLNANQGYIFYGDQTGTLYVDIDPATLPSGDQSITLTDYPSFHPDNANWNFVGNPYYETYNVSNIVPAGMYLYIWNGDGYYYKEAGRDSYNLRPLEAFFVQKKNTENSVNFAAASAGAAAPARAWAANSNRYIDIAAVADGYTDYTRVVLNETASVDYTVGYDLAKFFSDEAPIQLFTLDAQSIECGVQELPNGVEEIALGYTVLESGEVVVSATDMEDTYYLYDAETGITTDLRQSNYTFTAEAGTTVNRLSLRRAPGTATGVDGVNKYVNTITKVIREGHVLILRGDRIYDLRGQEVQ